MADLGQSGAHGRPYIPPEIWTTIVSHLCSEDVTSAWLAFRAVAKTQKEIVEHYALTNLLPDLEVVFNTGDYVLDRLQYNAAQPPPSPPPETTTRLPPAILASLTTFNIGFKFSRFSEDGKRVVMVESFDSRSPKTRTNPAPKRSREETKRAFQMVADYHSGTTGREWYGGKNNWLVDALTPLFPEGLRPRLQSILVPIHVVSLRGILRESELPELEFDADKLEISFDHHKMLSLFFGEEAYESRGIAAALEWDEGMDEETDEEIYEAMDKQMDGLWDVWCRTRLLRFSKLVKRHGSYLDEAAVSPFRLSLLKVHAATLKHNTAEFLRYYHEET